MPTRYSGVRLGDWSRRICASRVCRGRRDAAGRLSGNLRRTHRFRGRQHEDRSRRCRRRLESRYRQDRVDRLRVLRRPCEADRAGRPGGYVYFRRSQMDGLSRKGQAHPRRNPRNLFGNKLVLIEPSDADVKLEIAKGFDLAGATGDGKIAVCAIDLCPGGIYAKEALELLGVFTSVEPKLAQADSVRNALILVSRGEARFGIVYATDAKADSKVKLVGTFPASSHSPIIYPVALVAASANPDAAYFLAYITSQTATKIFLEQGFDILSK